MIANRRTFGSRRALLLVGSTLLSLAFAYLAVRRVDLAAFSRALRQTDYVWLVPALGALAVAVAVRGLRWQLLFRRDRRPAVRPVMSAMLIGYLLNNVLPFRAGEAARIVALNQRAGTSRAETLGTVITERVYDVAGLLVVLFAAYPFLPSGGWTRRAALFTLVFGVVLVAVVLVLVLFRDRPVRFVLRPLARLPWFSTRRMERAAESLHEGLAAFVDPRVAAIPFVLTVASWLVLGLSFWLVMVAFHLGLGFDAALLVVVATNLAMLVPAGPAAIGVFEAATVYALADFGIGASTALSYAVVLHALNVIPLVAAGYVALQRHALRLGRASGRGRLTGVAEAGRPAAAERVEEEPAVGDRVR